MTQTKAMTQTKGANKTAWLTEPLTQEVSRSVDRLRRSDNVHQVALMPDIHLAKEVCVGVVVATDQLIYPFAVGGDIGCGMVSLAFQVEADEIDEVRRAEKILAGLYDRVPANKHRKPGGLPETIHPSDLSDSRLQRKAKREGRVQLGTLGRGNHFLEFQSDLEGQLWIMIHSGSRAMGQAIMGHHLKHACASETGLPMLPGDQEAGALYLADAQWARAYARENRMAMLNRVVELMHSLMGVAPDWKSLIHCDHNHVQRELHAGKWYWVHRKGAQSAQAGEPGIIPGSMGSASFHTIGRGCEAALMSSSHGAGRKLSRSQARQQIRSREFARQVQGLWYDQRKANQLRDEAPSAYKNIRQVMKAQRQLTRIARELRPRLTYKAP